MQIKNVYKLSLALLLLISCDKNKTSNQISKPNISESNLITVIFDERDYSKDTLWYKNGGYSPTLDLIVYSEDDDFIVNKIYPNNHLGYRDTVDIKSKKGIVLQHRYHCYFKSLYNFKPGDTVFLKI
ncbi:hypothetical protein OOZ15_19355 [Galbibacter sp. EGI 63066]|uniref:hypothetical protein n=1 Tax=Galbibacter sp. EGI 63066 TaxID=2993559 RepID=UPI00224897D2|nr:hypothetical protein [Galbibacter sp. EGI 63066]MCX2682116.1 hypothetical protein [Galbibacter sp. EGI 63066]